MTVTTPARLYPASDHPFHRIIVAVFRFVIALRRDGVFGVAHAFTANAADPLTLKVADKSTAVS